MQPSPDALASAEADIDIDAPPETVYAMISDITRMGEWSPETVGGRWRDDSGPTRGEAPAVGDWFEGHNRTPEREWQRQCEVAEATPGRAFTFVVDGVEANRTWWSYELAPGDGGGTRVTERWWLVNKTPAVAAATPEQFEQRVAWTREMLLATLAALKEAAERS